MPPAATSPASAHRIVPRPGDGALRAWVFAFLSGAVWFEVLWLAAREMPDSPIAPLAAAAVGVAAQLAFTAIEASLGVAAWGALGIRVRWGQLAPALLAVSVAEATAVAVAAGQTRLPEAWCALLAGPRAAPGVAPATALARAFAGFGALAVARLALAAAAHAAAAQVPWRRAAALVLVFYLATRLALWWSLDILQGTSFEPWSARSTWTTAGSA